MKPLVHFLVLGGLLFGVERWLTEPGAARQPVRIAAADVAALRAQWPQERQFRAALERHIREEVLLEEALRLDLAERDPVSRERMLANLRFAYAQAARSDDALLREARALGMARRDVVVRRRLIQLMEQRLARGAVPTASELGEALAQQVRRHGSDVRLSFRHVLFSGEPAATAALARLRRGEAVRGEPFLLGDEFAGLAPAQVARRFGAEFAEALAGVPLREWVGPLRSAYGLHLVRVEHSAAAPLDAAALRAPLAYALTHERQQRRARDETARLRALYRVELP